MSADNPTPAELALWHAECERKASQKSAKHEGMEWEEVAKIAAANLPETAPPLPYDMTEEGKRLARFRLLCPAEFMQAIKRPILANPSAFDAVAGWNGSFRGPLASGVTGTSKSRAAWSALGRLFVKENRSFEWFPVKRLVTEFERYESKDMADEFWRIRGNFHVLFVDDLDKINWQFESQQAALFQFYDWIYRAHKPCITTTNNKRDWWANKMGDAFTRRLFDDAHHAIQF